MKLKQQQQRHEKRSEKYQKMGVKKKEGEKRLMKLERGIVKQNGTRMQMNNWKKEYSTLYTNVSVPYLHAALSNFPQCGAYKTNYIV